MRRSHCLSLFIALFAHLLLALPSLAQDLTIESFDSTGQLSFNEVSTAETYRVEWAPSPAGPWTNTWDGLASIVATGSGSVTCSVPMCYRVVALVTNAPPPVPSGMVLIPAGSFDMGDAFSEGDSDELPVHSVSVSAFYMDATEVTKAQWDAVYTWAIANGYSFDRAGSGKGADHPVHTVMWYDVVKWCNARSEKEGRTPCYTVSGSVYRTGQSAPDCNWSAAGYRLPTEAEWEKAARGGLSGQRFPWGANINHDYANYRANGSAYSYDTSPYTSYTYHPDYDDGTTPYTSPVGSFAANGYGLYDMSGNVWEWCWDWYDGSYYSTSPGSDPHGPASGSYRVFRGGSWYNYASLCRVANRFHYYPDIADYGIGFRAVVPPGQ